MAKDLTLTVLLDFYGEMLTQKQRDMIEFYYNDDLSLAEIAANEGITRQGVRDAIKRAEGQLFTMEERIGLVARFARLKDGLERIAVSAGEIERYNDCTFHSREIREWARGIKQLANDLND